MFPNRMRYFARNVINPLTSRSAGSAHSQFALMRHIGRKSGKTYETPIIAFPRKDHFVIALTYGPKVDWYRNLQAVERGTLRWHGKDYEIEKPEAMDRKVALQSFTSFQRFLLRLFNNQYFISVKSLDLESSGK